MKRVLSVLLAALLLVGCVRLPARPAYDPSTDLAPSYATNWAYACLSPAQQRNYAAVYNAVRNGFTQDTHVTVTENGETNEIPGISVMLPSVLSDEKQLRELYDAFMQDNPEAFHVGSVYGYDGRQHAEGRTFTALKLTYTMTAAERMAARETLEKKRETLLSLVTPSMTDFEKEVVLHDALINGCTYDTETAESADPLNTCAASFTVYGALVNGKAVCEGYARAMQYVLQAADIPATVVTGYDGEGQPHLWNALKLDDTLYYLDATWNDTDDIRTYTYFNLNTEELLCSHRLDERTQGLVVSGGTEGNYYRMTGSYLSTLRIEELAEHIAERITEGDGRVHLRLTDDAFSNALFFTRSTAWFLDTVNACRPQGTAAVENYTYTYNETHKTITICKKTS